jgi:hypothetical protein
MTSAPTVGQQLGVINRTHSVVLLAGCLSRGLADVVGKKAMSEWILLVLEVLNRAFVRFRRFPRSERTQIASTASLEIFLARVQPIPPGLQFSYHDIPRSIVRGGAEGF